MQDNSQPMDYNFEIETILYQFTALIDNAVVFRYNKDEETLKRKIVKKVTPRYTFGTKNRVFYYLNNKAKNYTLPVITNVLTGIKVDKERYSATYTDLTILDRNKPYSFHKPVPITLTIKTTIIAKYITDLYQIFAKFANKFNPYAVFSWYVPRKDDVTVFNELRSKVVWDGNFGIEAREKVDEKTEELFTATMSFEIAGWCFSNPLSQNHSVIYDIGTSVVLTDELLSRIDYSDIISMDSPLVSKILKENGAYNNPREFATAHLQICKVFLQINGKNSVNNLLLTKDRYKEVKNEINNILQNDKECSDVAFLIDGYNFEECSAIIQINDEYPLEQPITFEQNTDEKNMLFPEKNQTERKEKEITCGIPINVEKISKNKAKIHLSDIIEAMKLKNITDVENMDVILYNSYDYDSFNNGIRLI